MADEAILTADNTNGEETLESIIESNDSTEDKLAKLQEANKKLFARAKAAEEKAKAQKVESPHLENNPQTNSLSREEAILIAQGTDTKSLELLAKIAKVDGTSLLEAKESDIYKAYIGNLEQLKRAEQSKLGASKGSGRIESNKVSGMSREEHMAYVKEKMG